MSGFPYESQWGDLACNRPLIEDRVSPADHFDWRADGYPSESEYLFWSHHVCGLACLRSVLRGWDSPAGRLPMYELIRGAERAGALVRDGDTVRGLYYAPFVRWVQEDFGLAGTVRPDLSAGELLGQVSDGVVALASVSAEIRYPQKSNSRRGGHLVLVHEVVGDEVVFNNPSGIGDTAWNARVDIRTFERFYAGRGVTLSRP